MIIESKFDITNNNRPDGGNGRHYQLDNVASIIETSQWAVNQKQLLGYYGHPNSLLLKENIQNQPSNVCTSLKLNGNIVEHTQQVLETPTGKVVTALHKAGAGGWSWRAAGQDGGREEKTTLTDLAGFDYVHQPSFTAIKESVDNENGEYAKIRYHLINEGLSTDFADGFLNALDDSVAKEIARMKDMVFEAEKKTTMMTSAMAQTTSIQEQEAKDRLMMVRETLAHSPYMFKDKVVQILARGAESPEELRTVLEALTQYQTTDLSSLPLSDKGHQKVMVSENFSKIDGEVEVNWDRIFDRSQNSF